MNVGTLIKIASALLLFCCSIKVEAQTLKYVQPLSGTAPSTTAAALKHSEAGSEKNANTIPAVALPFGMTQWTPQTRTTEVKCLPPYYYKDSLFSGFRGTHWLSGSCTQDYGSFTVMPLAGRLNTEAKNYAAHFSHNDETTGPAYYKLDIKNIRAEVTATLRCGIMRFTAQKDDSVYLLVSPNSDLGRGFIRVDAAKGQVWGYNPVHRIYQGWGQPAGFNGWFFIQVQNKVETSGVFNGNELYAADSLAQKKKKGYGRLYRFCAKKRRTVGLKDRHLV